MVINQARFGWLIGLLRFEGAKADWQCQGRYGTNPERLGVEEVKELPSADISQSRIGQSDREHFDQPLVGQLTVPIDLDPKVASCR